MAIKKSELYSSLWSSCDELRGGMDASQYKDYVLVLLFVKYISDRYAGQPYAAITIPPGASFADMVALKGKPDIGDQINKKILGPLAQANRLADMPDFNNPEKLGTGREIVERLTNLIAIFENPSLDFSKNRAEGDDLLGDAYEYLMRHFATESGKSKGQFYTPAEVSRVIAQILGIRHSKATANTTVYDPTCGSGSLLLKVGDEAAHRRDVRVTLYGQEKDNATAGLARMNMILHDYATAEVRQGNTIANPLFLDGDALKTFDYVVANPPFSDKRWSTGLDAENDPYQRFQHYGVPPKRQGDYAYLLHILRSLKSTGKGACIMPHGVLFRAGAEGAIRRNLVQRGYIKGIIGLPPNLFYGTGIPACIVLLEKEGSAARKGIFMIDASRGFMKEGPKNRLREQDIHKIVDTFTKQLEIPRYSRLVPVAEIAAPKNDYNLVLLRYIDSSDPEDIQDIDGHLRGGIPERDIDALEMYWRLMPSVRETLFQSFNRPGYQSLRLAPSQVNTTILDHPEFATFRQQVTDIFARWREEVTPRLTNFGKDGHPKALIESISEDLLTTFRSAPLLDAYDVYQHLTDYWVATMQDDIYAIAAEGWVAKTERIVEIDKKGRRKDKGWTCDLIPKPLIVARYFSREQAMRDAKQVELETIASSLGELEDEHGDEEGYLGALDKVAKAEITARLKEIEADSESKDETVVLQRWLELSDFEAEFKRAVRDLDTTLDTLAYEKYPDLSESEIKTLVVVDKWMGRLSLDIEDELARVSQRLTDRVHQLAERYAVPLPRLAENVATLSSRVENHLKRMGARWS